MQAPDPKIKASGCLLILLLGGGCAAHWSGTSAGEIVPPPPVPVTPSDPNQKLTQADQTLDYIDARPKAPMPIPVYPPKALAAKLGAYTLFLTLTIDEQGNATDIHPSPSRIELPNAYSEAFFEAARDALQTWTFQPAKRVYWRKEPGKEREYLRTEPDTVTFEVKYTFDASGKVR